MEQQGLFLQNQLLHQEIRRRVDQISAINTVATTVGHSLDLQVTLDTALKAVTDVVGAEAAGISLIDYETGDVVLRAQLGWINDFVVNNPMRIPAGEGMSGQVIQNDDLIVHNNLTGQEDYAVPSFSKEAFRSIAMAPMHARGRIIGILSIMSHRPDRFDKELVEVLKAIADT
ncbi:MAG: GAF domain-containing protein, partial [Anaerolineae bacterium]|nr:GAF domain-containing protein [Anaerolineae bacterium]